LSIYIASDDRIAKNSIVDLDIDMFVVLDLVDSWTSAVFSIERESVSHADSYNAECDVFSGV